MQTLTTLRDSDIFPGAINATPHDFRLRQAVRAVLLNDEGEIALLQVGKYNFHKLPGGEIEDGEDEQQALTRELLEELGCRAEVLETIGEVIEHKNEQQQKQVSHCWLARQLGETHLPAFTEKEASEGFRVAWAKNIDHAIALLRQDQPTSYTGSFIRMRDLTFLQAAKEVLRYAQRVDDLHII